MAKVSAKLGKEGTPVEVEYAPLNAANVSELVKEFGEEVVVAHAKGSITVSLQSLMRGLIKKETSQAEIQKAVAAWKPGTRVPGKSKLEKAEDLVGKMTPEERKELLKKLRG